MSVISRVIDSARSATLVAAALGAALAPGTGCAIDTEAELDTSASTTPGDPTDPGPTPPQGSVKCVAGRVLFDGQCRATSFFERFLSTGASLFSVSGPGAPSADDTGVVILELLSENAYNLLYVDSDKALPGEPRLNSYSYRADYPLVFQQSVTTWQDEDGFLHMFFEDRTTGVHGGLRSWKHFAKTASGYEILDSDGGVFAADADGEAGDYCDLASSAAKVAATGACMGAALVEGALSGAAIGVLSGCAITAFGTAGSFGTAGPEAVVAGLGVGTSVGAAWFGGVIGVGAVVCGTLGEVVEEAVDTLVCEEDLDADAEFEFLPVIPSVPVFPAPSTGTCPGGSVLYSGEVMQCTSQNSIENVPGVGDVESIEVLCIRNYVYQQCVYI